MRSKFPYICLTVEGKHRKNLNQEIDQTGDRIWARCVKSNNVTPRSQLCVLCYFDSPLVLKRKWLYREACMQTFRTDSAPTTFSAKSMSPSATAAIGIVSVIRHFLGSLALTTR